MTQKEDSRVVATLATHVRTYAHTPTESPADRWRRRTVRAIGWAHDADRILNRTANGLVAFTGHHKRLLLPDQQHLTTEKEVDHVSASSMRSHLQILTTPTADTPGTTLLLHFDNKRYLIGNFAEGTQRACVQMGARLLKVSEAFITGRTEWANIGGLFGMILTLADGAKASATSTQEEAKKRALAKGRREGLQDDEPRMHQMIEEAAKESNAKLTLFGAPNLNHTLATARRFVFRKGMPVHAHEIDESSSKIGGEGNCAPYWADENVKVWAMSISPTDSTMNGSSNGTSIGTVSPRKRSIEEVYSDDTSSRNIHHVISDLSQRDRDLLTCKAVVSEMFDSSWRLDTLHETRLADVRLPAVIFIRNPETNKIGKYHGPLAAANPATKFDQYDPSLTVLVRKPWPGALVDSLPPTKPAKEAISYIFRNHIQRGKFHPGRAKECKVEKGPKWAQLQSGQNVLNADGETITPDMVLGESKEGGGVAVVDLPDATYINALVSRREWREEAVMAGVGAMVWICGPNVVNDERLASFMKEFGHLEHVVSSRDVCANGIALDSTAAATVRLRQVDPARYVVPVHNNTPSSEKLPPGVQVAMRGQTVQLEPAMAVDVRQVVPALNVASVEAETSQDVLEEADKARRSIEDPAKGVARWASSIPSQGRDAEIATLGTGSALPSKYRNVSATLLRVPGWGSMLFDCGENTLGQLKRVFEPEELKQVLRELRMIFISHMHADHHLGTVSVVKAWYEARHGSQPLPPDVDPKAIFQAEGGLAVVSEPAMQHWLAEYAQVEDYGHSRIAPLYISMPDLHKGIPSTLGWFIPIAQLAFNPNDDRAERLAQNSLPAAFVGLQDIQVVPVQHCRGARAVSVTFSTPADGAEPFKVSYSGDCRPSKAFSQIGKGSTVCIHEATFDDELKGDAQAKNHSTTSEALGVAQAMGAKACVLTHFSQRYQKLPVLEHGMNGEGKAVTDSLSVSNATETEEDESTNPEDALDGPLEDAAATVLDQEDTSSSQQYDVDDTRNAHARSDRKDSVPAAVKLKLASDMRVCVAFDYMRVKVAQIAELESFTPALLKLFAEEEKPSGNGHSKQESGKAKKEKKSKGQSAVMYRPDVS